MMHVRVQVLRWFSILLCSLFLNSAFVRAEEPTPAWAPQYRTTADNISTGLVLTNIGFDTVHSLRAADPKRALLHEGIRLGATIGISELTKLVIHRTRPDGTDTKSFFSEHTALAFASGGWNVSFSIPIGMGAGYGRMAADRHHPSDVAVGAVVGSLIRTLLP